MSQYTSTGSVDVYELKLKPVSEGDRADIRKHCCGGIPCSTSESTFRILCVRFLSADRRKSMRADNEKHRKKNVHGLIFAFHCPETVGSCSKPYAFTSLGGERERERESTEKR